MTDSDYLRVMRRVILPYPPQDRDQLWWAVKALFGVSIPRTKVCPDHCAPFDAFADAYFRECTLPGYEGPISRAIWHASRGLAGKSYTVATLGLTFAYIIGADITILGGSLSQSNNVHEYMVKAMEFDGIPDTMTVDQTATRTKLTNSGRIRPLPASQRNVRGPHPSILLMDEADEMDLDIYDAALGQPMQQGNYLNQTVDTFTVVSSTWQNPTGTFTEILRRAEEKHQPVYQWCYKESSNPIDGWLSQKTIAEKIDSVSAEMFRIEYDLGEPSIGNRAFDPEAIEKTFCLKFDPTNPIGTGKGYIEHKLLKDFEEYRFARRVNAGQYVAGADWAKEQDKTVIWVARIDGAQRELVYFLRLNRRPYPQMIGYLNKVIGYYRVPLKGVWHDSTGLGNVVNDYLDVRAKPFPMTGDKRAILLSDYVNAVEKGMWKIPRIQSTYLEHKYCVKIGSLVWTMRGLVPIEQVKVGDMAMTRVGWRPVTAVMDNGVRPVSRLRLRDGHEVTLTGDHSVATGRGWVPVDQLEVGDVAYVGLADAAVPASGGVDSGVAAGVGVPVGAVGGGGVGVGDAVAAADVLGLGDGFQVGGVAARSAGAASFDDVVDDEAVRDGADEQFVGQSVGGRLGAGCPDPRSAIAEFVALAVPYPALADNGDPVEDVLLGEDDPVGMSGAGRAPGGVGLLGGRSAIGTSHVLDITPAGTSRVFDLTVEGEHEFFADGICVHNCSTGDLYSPGNGNHLPDTVCAAALAEYAAKRFTGSAAPVTVPRTGSVSKMEEAFTGVEDNGHRDLQPDPGGQFSLMVG